MATGNDRANVTSKPKSSRSLVEWDPKLSAGEILTITSIIISVFTLSNSINQDRQQRESEQANRIRTAAAVEMAKLEQWKRMHELYFQDLQFLLVETARQHDGTIEDKESTRDYLWSALDDKRAQHYNRILNEDIATSYIDLYGYHEQVGQLSLETIRRMQIDEQNMFNEVQQNTQTVILDYSYEGIYNTSDLGDELRGAVKPIRDSFSTKIDNYINCLGQHLTTLMRESDEQLIKNIQDAIPVPPCVGTP